MQYRPSRWESFGSAVQKGGYQLLANDHSHALIREHANPLDLGAFYAGREPEIFFRSTLLRDGVRPCSHLSETLDMIEGMDDHRIRDVVAGVPEIWMPDDAKEAVAAFLCARAHRMKAEFGLAAYVFPGLHGMNL